MPDETPTGDLEAKTTTPEHQEAEIQIDTEDGYVYDFRNLDDQPPMPKEENGEAQASEEGKPVTPTGEGEPPKAEKGKEAEPKPKPEPNQEVATMRQTIEKLSTDLANQNQALNRLLQAKKTEPKDEALTDTQLDELFKLHADDPVELRKLVAYTAQQAAKRGKEDTLNALEVQEQKRQAEAHVMTRWKPVLDGPEGPHVRQAVDGFKRIMGIENHPLSEHLAFAVFAHENLPQIQQFWYEKGKSEALTAAADKGRKEGLKDKLLTPSGKGKEAPVTGGNEAKYLANAKALGLSAAATKSYVKAMMGKARGNPSMMADAR